MDCLLNVPAIGNTHPFILMIEVEKYTHTHTFLYIYTCIVLLKKFLQFL